MGILDWLTSDVFGAGAGAASAFGGGINGSAPTSGVDPMGNPMGGQPPPVPLGMPPVQPMDEATKGAGPGYGDQPMGGAAPPVNLPPDQPMGGASPGAPPPVNLPPDQPMGGESPGGPPQIPLPMPRPSGAPGPAGPAGLPPGAQTAAMAPPMSLAPPAAPPGDPDNIRNALGLTRNQTNSMLGGIGAGLTAAGNSAGKSPGQAFFGGAGASMEGSTKADDKTAAEQDKYLGRAIAAKQAGNTAEYNTNYLKYLTEKAKTDQALSMAKATATAKGGTSNSPEQLYAKANTLVNSDQKVKAAKDNFNSVARQFGPDSKEAKDALKIHSDLVDATLAGHYKQFGLDPKKAAEIGKQPGMSKENPLPKTAFRTQADFDKLEPGTYFINPKDGQVLIKQPPAGAAPVASGPQGANQPGSPGPAPSMMPPLPGGANPSLGDED